jgi:hypothetical protein
MPRLSVWFIRASLLYLLLGFFFGGLILAPKGIPFYAPVWILFPLHVEFLLVGWLVQLALGAAFWILPRFSGAAPRGPATLVWVSFALLNAGILLAALQIWLPAALLIGRIAETLGALLFVVGSWRRVKPSGAFK